MKKLLLIVVCLLSAVTIYAQNDAERTVTSFVDDLRRWCSTGDIRYRQAAENQCSSACRVSNELMGEFARLGSQNLPTYVVNNYLNGFEKYGPLSIDVRNVEIVPRKELWYGMSKGKLALTNADDYTVVKCDVVLGGSFEGEPHDVYYVDRSSKIVTIGQFVTVVDEKSGKEVVPIAISDLKMRSLISFTYNYGQHFPLELSVSYGWPCSAFSNGAKVLVNFWHPTIEFGMNFDHDVLSEEVVDLGDTKSYSRTTLGRKWFIALPINLFGCPYFEIGCSVGLFCMTKTTETGVYSAATSSSLITDGDYSMSTITSTSALTSSSQTEHKTRFMLRPYAKGYIPLCNHLDLIVSAGYDLVFVYTEKNGFNFGLGMRIAI